MSEQTDGARPARGGEGDKTSPASGLSQFLGRVLEQLSLASWLPAAMLVGNLAVLIEMHTQHSADVGHAINQLTASALGIVIALLFAVLLAAIVTQAFEFEVIRLLEGYLTSLRGPVPSLIVRRVRRHVDKRKRFRDRLREQEYRAFVDARRRMLARPPLPSGQPAFSQSFLDAVERSVTKASMPQGVSVEFEEAAAAFSWREFVPADVLYKLDALNARLGSYPDAHRVLPTRLGNVMRATEDQLTLRRGENLEGYVLRHHEKLPEMLRNVHHDYRTRLDMYSGLALIFVVLAGAGGGLLAFADWWVPVVLAGAYLLLAAVAYEATIASGRGYGLVLREINQRLREDGADCELEDERRGRNGPSDRTPEADADEDEDDAADADADDDDGDDREDLVDVTRDLPDYAADPTHDSDDSPSS